MRTSSIRPAKPKLLVFSEPAALLVSPPMDTELVEPLATLAVKAPLTAASWVPAVSNRYSVFVLLAKSTVAATKYQVLLFTSAEVTSSLPVLARRVRKLTLPAPRSPSDSSQPLVLTSSSARMRCAVRVRSVVRNQAVTVKPALLPSRGRLPGRATYCLLARLNTP